MTDVVVIAAEADFALAEELASALTRAGVEAAAQKPGAALQSTAFVLFCLTNSAPGDNALVKLVWRETPMKEDPAGRFVFAVFDPGAAANENFAPFLKRHFAAAGDDADAFAAHINKHRGALAAQVKAAEEEYARVQGDVAKRIQYEREIALVKNLKATQEELARVKEDLAKRIEYERERLNEADPSSFKADPDSLRRGELKGSASPRVEGVGAGTSPEEARRSDFLAEMYRKRAAEAPSGISFPRPAAAPPPPRASATSQTRQDRCDGVCAEETASRYAGADPRFDLSAARSRARHQECKTGRS